MFKLVTKNSGKCIGCLLMLANRNNKILTQDYCKTKMRIFLMSSKKFEFLNFLVYSVLNQTPDATERSSGNDVVTVTAEVGNCAEELLSHLNKRFSSFRNRDPLMQ